MTARIVSPEEASVLLTYAVPRDSGLPKFLVTLEQLEIDLGPRGRLVVSGHP